MFQCTNRPMYPCSNVPIDLCTHVPYYVYIITFSSIDITTKEYQRTAFSGKARLIKNIKKKSSVPSSKPSKGTSKPTAQVQVQKHSTGNKTVDHNLDQLEFGLKQLERQAYLIGSQLDESNDQLERIRVKKDRNDIRIKDVKKDKHTRGSDTLTDEMNLREVKPMFGSMVNHFTKPQIPLADKMIRLLQSYILHLFSSSGMCVPKQ